VKAPAWTPNGETSQATGDTSFFYFNTKNVQARNGAGAAG